MLGFLKKKQKPIELSEEEKLTRHRWEAEPRLGAGCSYEIGVCNKRDCEIHSNDNRYVWNKWSWTLTPEIWEHGSKLKKEYFKKYGDYGPARGRPENTWMHQL